MRAVLLLAGAAAVAPVLARPAFSDQQLRELFYGPPVPLPPMRWDGRAAANTTLRAAAQARGIFIGSAMNAGYYQNASDPLYASTFFEQFSLSTAENSCKFAGTEPTTEGQYTFTDCDLVLSEATGSDRGAFRLHNLIWGVDNPAWLSAYANNTGQLTAALEGHIAAVAGHYAGKGALCWDVVNEPISDNTATVLKDTIWYPAVSDYIPRALRAAKAADPNIKLFINDYGVEPINAKSNNFYSYVQGLLHAGVPLDGVGLQMHISVNAYPDPKSVSQNIARFGALGLEVHITEMDVRCDSCDDAKLQTQAQIYGSILQACLDNASVCKSFETWGFTDLHTWLWSFNNPTHQNVMPLPFDINYNPKPAFYEMLTVLQQ